MFLNMASSTTVSSAVTNMTPGINDSTSKVSDSSHGWAAATTPRVAFLSFFMAFGFVGNLFLIITVCQSQKFRAITFYIFILNLAVVNLCECVFNMSILLAASILDEWRFGDVCCSLSVFFLSFISVETVLGLTVLTVDRLIAVRYKEKYDHVVSTPRISILIVFTWCQSFGFSIPLAVGAVPTTVNNYTKSCIVARNASITYGIFASFLCFIVPLVLMIIMFVKIIRTGYRERVLIRTLISQLSYKDDAVQEPRIKQEIRHSNLTGTACGTWLCIQGPYLVTYYFNQVKSSSVLEPVASDDMNYVWYIDLVLLWLRFSYVLVLPIANFTWNKELWKSFKDLILCRKNNSIEDESFKKNETDTLRLAKKIGDEERAREKAKEKDNVVPTPREQRVFQVPVLFATSHGVHIQTSSQKSVFEREQNNGQPGTLRGKKCDVIDSRENLNMEEDTSDYDSANEMDPFSVSNPVSVKQLQSELMTERQRSISNPEVRESIEAEETMVSKVGTTTNGDSGLDLSSGTCLHNADSITHNEADTQTPGADITPTREEQSNEVTCRIEHARIDKCEQSNDGNVESVHNNEVDIPKDETQNTVQQEENASISKTLENEPEKVFTIKNKKSFNNGPKDSPSQRRKKKRRKDKSLDTLSTASEVSCSALPLRPPARLTPIAASVGVKRPGSSCSSQCSFVETLPDNAQCVHASVLGPGRCRECDKTDNTSIETISISSVSGHRTLGNTQCVLRPASVLDNQTEKNEAELFNNKREIKSVPEEMLNSSVTGMPSEENAMTGPGPGRAVSFGGLANEAYERLSESETTPDHPQARVRNTEARRKRRERLSANSILGDGKGYTRLIPETP